MIIRKPYAFLIKNFKKIHIVLLLLSLFVAYKLFTVSRFVADFMSFGTYDLYSNPASKYISTFLIITLLLLVLGCLSLILLLRYKKKPWKIYLIPLIEYLVLIFVLSMIRSFFAGFNDNVLTTDLRMSRDLLSIFMLAQLPAIGIFVMRVFGLDINKFNFNMDQEFLELSEEDREEVEIDLSIDKESIKRLRRRTIRNLSYFYLEHKLVCNIIFSVIALIFAFNIYQTLFVTNKSYSEGDKYNIDGYSIVINNSYITNKDMSGEVISSKSKFLILDVSITNNDASRVIDFNNFHIKNGSKDYVTTKEMFSLEFSDLGDTYKSVKKVKKDEKINSIIIYKVDNRLLNNRFVLYYQEKNGELRRIKLNTKDISEVKEVKRLRSGDSIDVKYSNYSDSISLDIIKFSNSVDYKTGSCSIYNCESYVDNFTAPSGYKILDITFGSEVFENKNMIDFFTKYGKIIYKDSDGESRTLDVNFAIKKVYYGKKIYLLVPSELESAKDVHFEFTIRDMKYEYYFD